MTRPYIYRATDWENRPRTSTVFAVVVVVIVLPIVSTLCWRVAGCAERHSYYPAPNIPCAAAPAALAPLTRCTSCPACSDFLFATRWGAALHRRCCVLGRRSRLEKRKTAAVDAAVSARHPHLHPPQQQLTAEEEGDGGGAGISDLEKGGTTTGKKQQQLTNPPQQQLGVAPIVPGSIAMVSVPTTTASQQTAAAASSNDEQQQDLGKA